ncbi:8104_t:CDS:1 [Diversispora eburnea]|uniref:8104_t:CDS:1 n=1 Tax=Diversispora eburnea TaxID=1213867 RepID=A0A9N8ZF86_9GLOM|nr:8104_t:CDS:1 [Diversispora eburnea]
MGATLHQPNFSDAYFHCTKKRTYPLEEEKITDHIFFKRIKTFSTSFSLPKLSSSYSPNVSCLNDKKNNSSNFRNHNIETNFPRIIDLSTGEQLESIPEQRSLKHLLEFEPQENFNNTDNDSDINFNKKFRASEKPTVNYIEEEEDERFNSTIDVLQELKLDPTITTIDSTSSEFTSKNDDQTVTAVNKVFEQTQNTSIITNDHAKKLQFTDKYQRAFSRYIRSQFELIKDESHEVYGKETISYYPNPYRSLVKILNNEKDNDGDDGNTIKAEEGKIVEIVEISDEDTIKADEGKIIEISDGDNDDDVEMLDVDKVNGVENINTNVENGVVMEMDLLGYEPLKNEPEEYIEYMEIDEMDIDL